MKRVVLAVALTLVAGEAFAISSYNSMDLSCAAVHARIGQEGAVIMRYGSHGGDRLFGRYVTDKLFCPTSTQPKYQYIPTADVSRCPVMECEYFDRETVFLKQMR
ncbi:hypothetical protein ACSBOB_12670 [Mesorhizobium sp. ASY16-5R]|uniref:hypothetical protein n=1 Tax=Mesorhizobium sp. ASY16-5R TaxID=3445772 RepID=UPI003FA14FF0